ncbi:hypothetical protein VSP10_08255 [Myroides odoratimimus]|uniref:DUF6892 domain-containing protein n=1 Tax=Myroides odoratimimus TaxID=76832 RepID=UPI002DB63338|nr:hypothetical protein [Myroides odoratimimus]MEC4052781.1 hypothetical protein [Myroides odoratimimus]
MGILKKLFGKEDKPLKKLVINVIEEGVLFNDTLVTLPVKIAELEIVLGKPSRIEDNEHANNTSLFWDNYGIRAIVKEDNKLDNIMIFFAFWDAPLIDPKELFQETLLIKGEDYKTAIKVKESDYLSHETFVGVTEVVLGLIEGTKEPETLYLIAKKEKQRKPKTNKYKHQKIAGEKIVFKDFNFKLAVIQELMYNQELLLPKFDVYEFVEEYRKRDIDIDDEGYEPIKEVVNYFKKLEIDQVLAEHITEIYQDGGNDIYMNIIPFWDGEDDAFDIKSSEDIKHFPNLKTMTLFSQEDNIIKELREKGIDVKIL